jgi:hypothetical protein
VPPSFSTTSTILVTSAEPHPESDLDPLLHPLCSATPEEEREVLHRILESGVDQGCFMRPPADHVFALDPHQLEALLVATAKRPASLDLTRSDPYQIAEPAHVPIEGGDAGWAILSQRCDLIRPYRLEPLVELGRASVSTDPDVMRAARLNSPRLLWLGETESAGCWVVDLRHRAVMPKYLLPDQESIVFPLAPSRPRKAFRLQSGQRYSRDAVPDDIVANLQIPLRKAIGGSAKRVQRAGHFTAFLVHRRNEELLLMALIADDRSRGDAEADLDEILATLQKNDPAARALLAEESGAFYADDIPFGLFLDSYKLDFDEVSRGKHAGDDHAQPRI